MQRPPYGMTSGYPPQPGGLGGYPPGTQSMGAYPPPGAQSGAYPPPQPGGLGGYPPGAQSGAYPPQPGARPPYGPGPGQPGQPGGAPGMTSGAYPPQPGQPGQPGGYPPQPGTQSMGGYPVQSAPSYSAQYYFNQLQNHEIQHLQRCFTAIDRDRSGEISSFELAQTDFGGFRVSLETAQMLVKVFDRDRSGQISFNEFASLYKFILSMKQAYLAYDQDRSGSIDMREASLAIHQAGFQLSPQTMEEVFRRFLKPPTARGLNLEQFIQLSAYLGILRNLFSQFDQQRTSWITINFDHLVQINLRSV